MVYELRVYTLKPGMRDKFVEFMSKKILPFQKEQGMRIHGVFTATEDETTYVWIRSFADMQERERLYEAVYQSEYWQSQIRPEVGQYLEKTQVTLMTPTSDSDMK